MIELEQVRIRAGDFTVGELSCRVPSGCYAVLMGRTGQGKTTLLEAICGLRRVAAGRIMINGEDITDLLPGDRGIGYVPQDLALFPNLSVRKHLDFALRLRKYSTPRIAERTAELAAMLGIEYLMDRSIQHLSGGESQRVALGRALSFWPSVLLLDEPLSALDHETRAGLVELLKHVQRTTSVTTLHVTHDHEEAELLADARLELTQQGLLSESTG